jgi:branched-chain amino acid aminotransferase
VFDGARAFEGVTPDLDLHFGRVNDSAPKLQLKAVTPVDTWIGLTADGLKRFDKDAAIYIRPMYWAERGGPFAGVAPDPESTNWCLCLYEAAMGEPAGSSITLSPFRRPTIECMPVDAKAGCLYPNNGRALTDANARGFDSCLMCDMLGNVAELASANVFMAKNGVVYTPAANGTFLAGITRLRTIKLLRDAGVTVQEATLRYRDFENADEIFSAGNYSKVTPVTRIGERSLQPGPFYRQARKLYWDYAHS